MLGVFGGTFDPIHLGHLRTALEVKQSLSLSRLHFIPCARPPHRDAPVAAASQRLALLRLAVHDTAEFFVDTRELDRDGTSYMVDTLESLREEFPEQILGLIMGFDAFAHFDTWKDYRRILQLAHLIVMQRPGSSPEQLQSETTVYNLMRMHTATEPRQLHEQRAGLIWLQPVTPLAISSSAIRAMLRRGESIRYLVPEPVYAQIERQQWYR